MALPLLTMTWLQDEVSRIAFYDARAQALSDFGGEARATCLWLRFDGGHWKFQSHFDINSGGRAGRTRLDYYDGGKVDESFAHVVETLERLVHYTRFISRHSDMALGNLKGMIHKAQSL